MGSVTTKKHANGLDYVEVNTALCQARIFLQGAQIDYFQPVGKPPLLWVSSADDYQPGNGIRGGVPVCWPWFGMSSEANFPQHGFARTRIWALESVEMRNQLVDLRFSLKISEQDKIYWPHNTQVSVLFTLGDTLSISLVNTNLGDETVTLTQALHTYFPIEDIHQLKASGFSGSKYIEFAEDLIRKPRMKCCLIARQIVSIPNSALCNYCIRRRGSLKSAARTANPPYYGIHGLKSHNALAGLIQKIIRPWSA